MIHPLKQLVADQKKGMKKGIMSVCSANEFVIEAVMENAKKYDEFVLIESTANQVNQFGGYTGMKPSDFVEFVNKIADKCDFNKDRLILGGDHLGPLTFVKEDEDKAMELAKDLIEEYVLAGFTKIHIDTSMKVASDNKNTRLSDETIAKRGAYLCKVAEDAYKKVLKQNATALAPVYVVGSEVPIPGGAQGEEEEGIQVTKVADFKATVETFKNEYKKLKLDDAWDRVIAIVVQPGVEFGDTTIDEYDREKAKDLVAAINDYPNLVFEGHSTDYQTPDKLKEMVEDQVAILKVGPAVTFALREALFALNKIEEELLTGTDVYMSNFARVLEHEMLKSPNNWQKHYVGTMDKLEFKRKYSLSDRCRYYLPSETVDMSIKRLVNNLEKVEIPFSLLSQYMPVQYTKVRKNELDNNPKALIKDRIINCADEYAYACGRNI